MSATAKAGEQHKDNNNNITKYLELKKDRIVDLAERNYENFLIFLFRRYHFDQIGLGILMMTGAMMMRDSTKKKRQH